MNFGEWDREAIRKTNLAMQQFQYLTNEETELFLSAITDDKLRDRLEGHRLHAVHLLFTLMAKKASEEILYPYYLTHPHVASILFYTKLTLIDVRITYPAGNSVQWTGGSRFHGLVVDCLSERNQ